jgi:hypothetical protein
MYEMTPDRIIRPTFGFVDAGRQAVAPKVRALKPDAKVAQLNLTGVYIIDNHEIGDGEVFLISTIVDGISKEPITVELKTFHGVKDDSALPLVDPGVTLYQNMQEVPTFLDWRLIIGESDSPIRDKGAFLKELAKDDDWKSVTATLKTALSTANPVAGVVVGLVDGLVGVIGRIMEINNDDQIGYLAVSYNKTLDDLGAGVHKAKVGDAWVRWMIRVE